MGSCINLVGNYCYREPIALRLHSDMNRIRWSQKLLSNWGRTKIVRSTIVEPDHLENSQSLLADSTDRLIVFGMGRSYGDASLNSLGRTISFEAFNRILSFDTITGVVVCEPGVTLHDLLTKIVPHGWFLPVTPGTRYPTLSGCVAANVHGKNHHSDGSIDRHINWIELMLADGSFVKCSATENSELFDATLGGMGLTGLICKVSMQLLRVESTWIHTETIRTDSLRQTMDELSANDSNWRYTVAWIDSTASGNKLGRGEVILGRHTTQSELPERLRNQPFELPPTKQIKMPFVLPISAVNPLTTRFFNFVYYWKQLGAIRNQQVLSAYKYFYPLDVVDQWNKLYSKPGFIQYQFVVPMDGGYDVIHHVLKRCLEAGHPSSLTVLKRFGAQEGPLSFPRPGWTMALDIAVRPGLFELLDELDELIIAKKGRIYLAKDYRMKPETFRSLYPDYPKWLEIKRKVDPDCRFSSDLSRRLKIDDDVKPDVKTMNSLSESKREYWLLVGATGGIGSELAIELAKQNKNLILIDIPSRSTELKQLAESVSKSSGVHIETGFLPESQTAAIDAFLTEIQASYGPIAGVIWAAGVMWSQSQLQYQTDIAIEHHNINYTQPMLFLERIANLFEIRGTGHIAAIGSPAGDRGRRSNYFYGADKAALHLYLQGLQHRFAGSKIFVTTIKPGPTRTPMVAGIDKLPLLAEPKDQAVRIVKYVLNGKSVVYTPGIWRYIMLIIRLLPKIIFDKLNL